jgi:hypothetical protein
VVVKVAVEVVLTAAVVPLGAEEEEVLEKKPFLQVGSPEKKKRRSPLHL